jgi:hypothetical protein
MLQPTCAICGQPATIHETVIEAGAAVTRHFCQEHGEAACRAMAPSLGDADSHQALEVRWRGLSEAEQEHLALLYRLTHR